MGDLQLVPLLVSSCSSLLIRCNSSTNTLTLFRIFWQRKQHQFVAFFMCFVCVVCCVKKMPQSGVDSMQGLLKVIFRRRYLSPKFVVHQRLSFTKLLSSTEGQLLPKVVFHRRSSSIEGCLPMKVVFHRRSSSTKGCLPPSLTPWLSFYL